MMTDGIREGLGIFNYDSGDVFIGEWKRNKIQGSGILFFSYGGLLRGQFLKNRMNGKGII